MTEHPDSEIIRAVRAGDLERFRELIDRYQGQVYAVAWARLGDATLAEDAVQESFIRAFRLLDWLRRTDRFAAWITRIAQAVAINLGLRNRRELQRRQRWALDPTTSATSGTATEPPRFPEAAERTNLAVPAETLHTALARLPVRHRECLVLFYLEAHSIAEAATALGIQTAAFKVRLYRARRALRGHLERHLEKTFGQLTPRHSLAPGIMASISLKGVVADPSGAGSGFLTVLVAGLFKLLPLPLLFLLFPIAAIGVGFTVRSWATRAEQNNYLNPDGFRRRLYRDEQVRVRKRAAMGALGVVAVVGIGVVFPRAMPYGLLALAPALIPSLVMAIRDIRLTGRLMGNNAFAFVTVALVGGFAASMLWNVPQPVMGAIWALYFVAMLIAPPLQPLRFDENIFLRQRLGLLPEPDSSLSTSVPSPSPKDLWAFARFGAREGLFIAWHGSADGLRLKLRPVSSSWWDYLGFGVKEGDSQLLLDFNGRAQARLGRRDAANLVRLGVVTSLTLEEEQTKVAWAVQASLHSHLRGDVANAFRLIGHVHPRAIFASDPARTGHARVHRIGGAAGLCFAAFMILAPLVTGSRSARFQAREARFEPVILSLESARALFDSIETDGPGLSRRRWDPILTALYSGHLLPPFEWLGPKARCFLSTNWVSGTSQDYVSGPQQMLERLRDWQSLKALCFQWDTMPTVALLREASPQLRTALSASSPASRSLLLDPEVVSVANADYSILDLTPVRWRVAGLKHLGVLDLFETRPLVEFLKSHQVLPGHSLPPDRHPRLDRRFWNGLMAIHGHDPIEETYTVLALLEDLDAVHVIDREACIAGILRLHLGQGLFDARPARNRPFARRTAPGEPRTSVYIPGDARTTFAARESLRILNGLEHVPDRDEWQYRVSKGLISSNPPANLHTPGGWQAVEAVLLRESASTH